MVVAVGFGVENAVRRRRALALAMIQARQLQRAEVGRQLESALQNWFGSLADRIIALVYEANAKSKSAKASLPVPTSFEEHPGNYLREMMAFEDLIRKSSGEEATALLKRYDVQLIAYSWDTWNAELGLTAAFDLTDPAVTEALAGCGTRVKEITDTTLDKLRATATYASEHGWSVGHWVAGEPAKGIPGLRDVVQETYKNRARAVARTELGTAQQMAATSRYEAAGVTKCLCLDDDGPGSCDACRILGNGHKGTVVPLEWAKAHALGHPNCRRCFAAEFDAKVDIDRLAEWGKTGDWGRPEKPPKLTPKPKPAPKPKTPEPRGLDYRLSGTPLEEVRKIVNYHVESMAQKMGVPIADVEALVTAQLKSYIDASPISIRRGERGSLGVATEGRFKTQFETGQSGGMFSPETRKQAEHNGLGAPLGLAPAMRPVYGYIDTPGSVAYSYGPVEFQLKPEVKNRATFTFGDSLGNFQYNQVAGAPVTNPAAKEGWDNGVDRLAQHEGPWDYLEVQIQGGVKLEDVQKVVIHTPALERVNGEWQAGSYYREAEQALRDKGITVEYDAYNI